MVDLSKQQLSSVGPRAYVENFYPILVPDTRQGPCIEKVISKWVGEPDYAGCRTSQFLRYKVERDLRVF